MGSSFDQHVVGGYRFLMRFYNPGDEIYMFGFSRGSYIARFLAEMLDYIGLLSHGNEEMVKFAWKAFAQWQCRPQSTGEDDEESRLAEKKKHEMFHFMKGFRETFSRPVGRIRFLGLFDTVNSVPRFETAWMQRSKFPYTAKSSAKVIRHAVSIDERRAKFRQDLMYQANPKTGRHRHRHLGEMFDHLHSAAVSKEKLDKTEKPAESKLSQDRGRPRNQFLVPGDQGGQRRASGDQTFEPYRVRSKSRQTTRSSQGRDPDTASVASGMAPSDVDPDWDEDGQDVDEVWFSGGHGDVGGGWEALEDSKSASHVPLAWVVREAIKAGLPFDLEKVAQLGCAAGEGMQLASLQARDGRGPSMDVPDIRIANGPSSPVSLPSPKVNGKNKDHDNSPNDFHSMMHKAHVAKTHDSLAYNGGLPFMAVSAWKFMEYLPFRRMDMKPDGTWGPISWPLPRGEVRDVPANVRVHGSVIRRMKMDENYRPGNLIVGGGGRGMRKAPPEYGMGEWECVAEHGDPVGEIWVRKPRPDEIPLPPGGV